MQPVLELGPIDKPVTFDVGLIQLSFIYTSVFTKYMQHFSQIAPRVCTLVLFITAAAVVTAAAVIVTYSCCCCY